MVARSRWQNAVEGLGEGVNSDIVDLSVVWHLLKFVGKASFTKLGFPRLVGKINIFILEGDVNISFEIRAVNRKRT